MDGAINMVIIPAIDLIDGKCVRLEQGDYRKSTIYSTDPLKIASAFADAGAPLIHLVDLDGARIGKPQNLEVIERIAQSINVPVEVGGGIRNLESIDAIFAVGVQRVVLGTAVYEQPEWFVQAVEKYGDRIIAGIDARDGMVAVKGWQEGTKKSALTLAIEMRQLGISELIYTDISRDGMLSGPNIAALKHMSKAKVKLIASGGVSRLDDIIKLCSLEAYGVVAVIVGKALYTNNLDLHAAINAAKV